MTLSLRLTRHHGNIENMYLNQIIVYGIRNAFVVIAKRSLYNLMSFINIFVITKNSLNIYNIHKKFQGNFIILS